MTNLKKTHTDFFCGEIEDENISLNEKKNTKQIKSNNTIIKELKIKREKRKEE